MQVIAVRPAFFYYRSVCDPALSYLCFAVVTRTVDSYGTLDLKADFKC